MQGGISPDKNVRFSVRLSVKRLNCDENERNFCQHLYTIFNVTSPTFPRSCLRSLALDTPV